MLCTVITGVCAWYFFNISLGLSTLEITAVENDETRHSYRQHSAVFARMTDTILYSNAILSAWSRYLVELLLLQKKFDQNFWKKSFMQSQLSVEIFHTDALKAEHTFFSFPFIFFRERTGFTSFMVSAYYLPSTGWTRGKRSVFHCFAFFSQHFKKTNKSTLAWHEED